MQPAFLRSLDAAKVLQPGRSVGGHRRYSRRELRLAARIRVVFVQGGWSPLRARNYFLTNCVMTIGRSPWTCRS